MCGWVGVWWVMVKQRSHSCCASAIDYICPWAHAKIDSPAVQGRLLKFDSRILEILDILSQKVLLLLLDGLHTLFPPYYKRKEKSQELVAA